MELGSHTGDRTQSGIESIRQISIASAAINRAETAQKEPQSTAAGMRSIDGVAGRRSAITTLDPDRLMSGFAQRIMMRFDPMTLTFRTNTARQQPADDDVAAPEQADSDSANDETTIPTYLTADGQQTGRTNGPQITQSGQPQRTPQRRRPTRYFQNESAPSREQLESAHTASTPETLIESTESATAATAGNQRRHAQADAPERPNRPATRVRDTKRGDQRTETSSTPSTIYWSTDTSLNTVAAGISRRLAFGPAHGGDGVSEPSVATTTTTCLPWGQRHNQGEQSATGDWTKQTLILSSIAETVEGGENRNARRPDAVGSNGWDRQNTSLRVAERSVPNQPQTAPSETAAPFGIGQTPPFVADQRRESPVTADAPSSDSTQRRYREKRQSATTDSGSSDLSDVTVSSTTLARAKHHRTTDKSTGGDKGERIKPTGDNKKAGVRRSPQRSYQSLIERPTRDCSGGQTAGSSLQSDDDRPSAASSHRHQSSTKSPVTHSRTNRPVTSSRLQLLQDAAERSSTHTWATSPLERTVRRSQISSPNHPRELADTSSSTAPRGQRQTRRRAYDVERSQDGRVLITHRIRSDSRQQTEDPTVSSTTNKPVLELETGDSPASSRTDERETLEQSPVVGQDLGTDHSSRVQTAVTEFQRTTGSGAPQRGRSLAVEPDSERSDREPQAALMPEPAQRSAGQRTRFEQPFSSGQSRLQELTLQVGSPMQTTLRSEVHDAGGGQRPARERPQRIQIDSRIGSDASGQARPSLGVAVSHDEGSSQADDDKVERFLQSGVDMPATRRKNRLLGSETTTQSTSVALTDAGQRPTRRAVDEHGGPNVSDGSVETTSERQQTGQIETENARGQRAVRTHTDGRSKLATTTESVVEQTMTPSGVDTVQAVTSSTPLQSPIRSYPNRLAGSTQPLTVPALPESIEMQSTSGSGPPNQPQPQPTAVPIKQTGAELTVAPSQPGNPVRQQQSPVDAEHPVENSPRDVATDSRGGEHGLVRQLTVMRDRRAGEDSQRAWSDRQQPVSLGCWLQPTIGSESARSVPSGESQATAPTSQANRLNGVGRDTATATADLPPSSSLRPAHDRDTSQSSTPSISRSSSGQPSSRIRSRVREARNQATTARGDSPSKTRGERETYPSSRLSSRLERGKTDGRTRLERGDRSDAGAGNEQQRERISPPAAGQPIRGSNGDVAPQTARSRPGAKTPPTVQTAASHSLPKTTPRTPSHSQSTEIPSQPTAKADAQTESALSVSSAFISPTLFLPTPTTTTPTTRDARAATSQPTPAGTPRMPSGRGSAPTILTQSESPPRAPQSSQLQLNSNVGATGQARSSAEPAEQPVSAQPAPPDSSPKTGDAQTSLATPRGAIATTLSLPTEATGGARTPATQSGRETDGPPSHSQTPETDAQMDSFLPISSVSVTPPLLLPISPKPNPTPEVAFPASSQSTTKNVTHAPSQSPAKTGERTTHPQRTSQTTSSHLTATDASLPATSQSPAKPAASITQTTPPDSTPSSGRTHPDTRSTASTLDSAASSVSRSSVDGSHLSTEVSNANGQRAGGHSDSPFGGTAPTIGSTALTLSRIAKGAIGNSTHSLELSGPSVSAPTASPAHRSNAAATTPHRTGGGGGDTESARGGHREHNRGSTHLQTQSRRPKLTTQPATSPTGSATNSHQTVNHQGEQTVGDSHSSEVLPSQRLPREMSGAVAIRDEAMTAVGNRLVASQQSGVVQTTTNPRFNSNAINSAGIGSHRRVSLQGKRESVTTENSSSQRQSGAESSEGRGWNQLSDLTAREAGRPTRAAQTESPRRAKQRSTASVANAVEGRDARGVNAHRQQTVGTATNVERVRNDRLQSSRVLRTTVGGSRQTGINRRHTRRQRVAVDPPTVADEVQVTPPTLRSQAETSRGDAVEPHVRRGASSPGDLRSPPQTDRGTAVGVNESRALQSVESNAIGGTIETRLERRHAQSDMASVTNLIERRTKRRCGRRLLRMGPDSSGEAQGGEIVHQRGATPTSGESPGGGGVTPSGQNSQDVPVRSPPPDEPQSVDRLPLDRATQPSHRQPSARPRLRSLSQQTIAIKHNISRSSSKRDMTENKSMTSTTDRPRFVYRSAQSPTTESPRETGSPSIRESTVFQSDQAQASVFERRESTGGTERRAGSHLSASGPREPTRSKRSGHRDHRPDRPTQSSLPPEGRPADTLDDRREQSVIDSSPASQTTDRGRRQRTQRGERIPFAAEPMQFDADVDRLVEQLYRRIERKKRTERERRGL